MAAFLLQSAIMVTNKWPLIQKPTKRIEICKSQCAIKTLDPATENCIVLKDSATVRDTEKNLTSCWDFELQRSCFVVKWITAHEIVQATNNNICMLSDEKYCVHLPGSPLRLSERQQRPSSLTVFLIHAKNSNIPYQWNVYCPALCVCY